MSAAPAKLSAGAIRRIQSVVSRRLGSGGGSRILIVDDDPAEADKVAAAVLALGHEPVISLNWTEALRLFEDSIDLVLMDAVMPEVDGFKLTKMLRERARAYTPILFVTALGDAAAKELGMSVGADDFLTKPVDAVELRVRMTAMLRIRRLTQELEAERYNYQRLAHVDELTGMPNRRSYDERLETELEIAQRNAQPLSLLLVDVDHFKRINDACGHSVGDEVLAFTGKLLRDVTRRGDWAFRYGGEEFAVLARGTGGRGAMVLAERIRATFEARSVETSAGRRTCSIGVASYIEGESAEELFARADGRLYTAKQSGRNLIVGQHEAPPSDSIVAEVAAFEPGESTSGPATTLEPDESGSGGVPRG